MLQGPSHAPGVTPLPPTVFRLIGRGDAPDLHVRALFHITVTPNGVVSVVVDEFSAECS